MLNNALKQAFEDLLLTPILNYQAIGGGSINITGKITTAEGTFFVKLNDAKKYPDMFALEAKGLDFLRLAEVIRIPKVYRVAELDDQAFLMMEFIEPGVNHGFFWDRFGQKLAQLHRFTGDQFGFEVNNYIGTLPQSNKMHNRFDEFFIVERLQPQLKLAIDGGKLDSLFIQHFEALYKALPEILPEEAPTMIHGDLWSGNYLADEKNEPVLVDPAAYFGHREMDLAMTVLFGGFPNLFFEAYEEANPTAPGLENRVEIYQLYYLLTHVNLFGGAYINAVKKIIQPFS
ncbi:MAG: fructosamine kinase family protein [Bacteroidota bacterium]